MTVPVADIRNDSLGDTGHVLITHAHAEAANRYKLPQCTSGYQISTLKDFKTNTVCTDESEIESLILL